MVNASFNSGTPKVNVKLLNSTSLIKASLVPLDVGVPLIQFMFNPAELTFDRAVSHNESKASKDEKTGHPKKSFSHLEAPKVTISKILFDTYEDGDDVVAKYIDPFIAAVEFLGEHKSSSQPGLLDSFQELVNPPQQPLPNSPTASKPTPRPGEGSEADKSEADKRTPHYRFVWGERVHLRRCVIEKLTYKLTLFLPDGTPVRAMIDSLTLKTVAPDKPIEDLKKTVRDRFKDSIAARLKANATFKL